MKTVVDAEILIDPPKYNGLSINSPRRPVEEMCKCSGCNQLSVIMEIT